MPGMMRLVFVGVSFLVSVFISAEGRALTPDEDLMLLKEEVLHLREGQKEIQKTLDDIQSLLKGVASKGTVELADIKLTLEGEPSKGSDNNPLVLVEFSDFQCPFCARHVQQTLPLLEKEYIQTGKIQYVFRDYPIENIHRQAVNAAEAANCAGEQSKYWEMHDQIFLNQKKLTKEDLLRYAGLIQLDKKAFQACLEGGQQAVEAKEDLVEGQKAGVRGTPTFFLGERDPLGMTIKVIKVIRGAQPFSVFKKEIDQYFFSKNGPAS